MKTKKLKPRFNSEEQITSRIDQCVERMNKRKQQAEVLEINAKELAKSGDRQGATLAGNAMDEADKLFTRAKAYEPKIARLKQKLAEMQTITLPFMEDTTIAR